MVSFFWCNEQVNCSIHSKFTKLFNYLFSQKNCDKCHVTCKSKQSKTWDSIFGLFYRNFTRVRCHCARTGARTQRSSKGDEYQRGCNGDGSCTRGRMVKASRAVVVTLHCSTTWSFLLKYFLFFPYRYDSRKTTEKIISIKIILRCSSRFNFRLFSDAFRKRSWKSWLL